MSPDTTPRPTPTNLDNQEDTILDSIDQTTKEREQRQKIGWLVALYIIGFSIYSVYHLWDFVESILSKYCLDTWQPVVLIAAVSSGLLFTVSFLLTVLVKSVFEPHRDKHQNKTEK